MPAKTKTPTKKKPVSANRRKPAKRQKQSAARWWLPAISLAVMAAALVFILRHYSKEQYESLHIPIETHKVLAVAKVLETSSGKSKRVHYSFQYKGISYENAQSDYNDDFSTHRCYQVQLDSTNPARSYLVPNSATDCEQ